MTGVEERLAQLATRFSLPEGAPPALLALLKLLASDRTAPTALRDPALAVDAHVADALVALDLDPVRAARCIADLGSGAGLPGLVLAAALPEAQVALVESSARKCAFVERAAAAMGLSNTQAIALRAEDWCAGIGTRDLVTARAVAPLNVLIEYAAPLLRVGGAFVAWKGRPHPREEHDGTAAAAAIGLELADVRRVEPWNGAERLHLYLYFKVSSTPTGFPRRAGIASKRPIRASTPR